MRREKIEYSKRSRIDTLSLLLTGSLKLVTLLLVVLCVFLFTAGLICMNETMIYASLSGAIAMTWINTKI